MILRERHSMWASTSRGARSSDACCRMEYVPHAVWPDNQWLVGAKAIGCSLCLASEVPRGERCTTEVSKLPDFQISHH
jgi:hypothetical protein